jgi:hypothetical protein
VLRLRYRVSDDRGLTSERITLYRRTKVLRLFSRPLRTTSGVAYWVAWRAPRAPGRYRFCVRAADGSRNHAVACAGISVR